MSLRLNISMKQAQIQSERHHNGLFYSTPSSRQAKNAIIRYPSKTGGNYQE
jgi:hypothetical protein